MNDHAVDAMLYAWLVMKEKGGYKMIDYINFGNVVNVSTSVPVAIDDSTYHIIIDFVPNDTMIFDNFHDDMAKILKHPDDYVLCNIEDIVKARDEIQELKDRVKELEAENTYLTRINGDFFKERSKLVEEKEALVERNTRLKTRLDKFYGMTSVGEELREASEKLKAENGKLKESVEQLKDQKKRLSDMAVYWNNRYTSVMTDFSKAMAANGVAFSVKDIDSDGNWNITVCIPELTEAKNKIAELEQKLRLAESRETYWRDRKEEEENHHHYWCNTFRAAEKKAFEAGVCIHISGEDRDINTGKVSVQNNRAEELEKELKDLKSKKAAEVRYEWGSQQFHGDLYDVRWQ